MKQDKTYKKTSDIKPVSKFDLDRFNNADIKDLNEMLGEAREEMSVLLSQSMSVGHQRGQKSILFGFAKVQTNTVQMRIRSILQQISVKNS
jgi:hypothetical protein